MVKLLFLLATAILGSACMKRVVKAPIPEPQPNCIHFADGPCLRVIPYHGNDDEERPADSDDVDLVKV